jgi:predicted PurR-regulated permease PerM
MQSWLFSKEAKLIYLAAGLLLAWQFFSVILLLFAGILVGVASSSLIRWTERRTGFGRGVSAAIAFTTIIVVIGGVTLTVIPSLQAQYADFRTSFPEAVENLEQRFTDETGITLKEQLFDVSTYEIFDVQSFAAATNTLSSTVGILVDTIFVVILGLYFSLDPSTYRHVLTKFVPDSFLDTVAENLQWWISGRLLSMAIVGVMTSVGLAVLDVPFYLILGILAGLLSFIPNLGPIIGYVPAAVVATIMGFDALAWVTALYVFVQLVESYFITPQIEKQMVDVPPALSLTAQIVFGTVFGFMGLLFAVPMLIVARTTLHSFW